MMWISFVPRFWLFLIFVIPSSLCGIFNLYHFLRSQTLRRGLNNHAIILILFFGLLYNLTDVVWLIYFYANGFPLSSTPGFCLLWVYIDYTGFLLLLLLGGWASVERHLLIFSSGYFSSRRKRFLFHYLPMILITVYAFLYYLIIFFLLSCDISPNYSKSRCGLSYCTSQLSSIAIWDNLVNNILPTFLIVIFSTTLIGRVWYQRYRMNPRVQWKNSQKSTIQLLSISFIYIILYFPVMTLNLAYTFGLSRSIAPDFYSTSLYLSYFVGLLIPFLCTAVSPELRRKLLRSNRRRRPVVGPQLKKMSRVDANRIIASKRII